MKRYLNAALLAVALAAPVTVMPLQADDRVYHDKDHNDDHHWNSNEDRAYRRWAKENHRRYNNFNRLKEDDQRAYWNWRHEHPDEVRDRH